MGNNTLVVYKLESELNVVKNQKQNKNTGRRSKQKSPAAWDGLLEPREGVPGLKQHKKLYLLINVV